MKKSNHSIPKFLSLLAISIFLAGMAGISAAVAADKYVAFVGTYTEGSKSKGIYAFSYDAANGKIEGLGLAAETTNPSWLAISPDGRFLYAVNEIQNYKGPNSGGVSAFSIDRDKNGHPTGRLTFLNEVRSSGADPCYVTVDKTGKWVLVANYTGGSVAVLPVHQDGSLGEHSDFVQHIGHGTNPQRQEGPHAHSIDLSPDNKFAFVDDLGLDTLVSYKFDVAAGKLTPIETMIKRFPGGAGPRHFALHPSGKFAYVIAEMQSTVTTLDADLQTGTLKPVSSISTVPPDYKGHNDAAEVEVHPSGRFLFASNRGHDSVIVFDIDPANGTLKQHWMIPSSIKTPRAIEIDPTGKTLFVANQDWNNIVVFDIDERTGAPTPANKVLDVASPVCIKFLPID